MSAIWPSPKASLRSKKANSTTASGKVEGEDAGGYEIKMKVDAFSGEIIKLKRDD